MNIIATINNKIIHQIKFDGTLDQALQKMKDELAKKIQIKVKEIGAA